LTDIHLIFIFERLALKMLTQKYNTLYIVRSHTCNVCLWTAARRVWTNRITHISVTAVVDRKTVWRTYTCHDYDAVL